METQPTVLYEPDGKAARRAASVCAFAAVLAVAIPYALTFAFSFLRLRLFPDLRLSDSAQMLLTTAMADLIAMPLVWLLLLRRVPAGGAAQDGATRTPLSLKKLAFYFPCIFLLMYGGAVLGRLIGALLGRGLADVVDDVMSSVDPWATLLCAVIIGPIAEELFFRKAMIDRLSCFRPTDAIVFTALLFALSHGNLMQFLYAFPVGVLFGIIYCRTRNVGYTIVLHVLMNAVGGLVPQLLTPLDEAVAAGTAGAFGRTILSLYGIAVFAVCGIGLVLLIRHRGEFLPIPSTNTHSRKALYLNAGWIVAGTLLIGLAVLSEILL